MENVNNLEGKKKEPLLVIKQKDGYGVFIKKSDATEFISLYRKRSDAQPLTDDAVIVSLASQFTDLPEAKKTEHMMQAHEGRKFITEINSAFDMLNPKPSKEWDVPCYMVFLYDDI